MAFASARFRHEENHWFDGYAGSTDEHAWHGGGRAGKQPGASEDGEQWKAIREIKGAEQWWTIPAGDQWHEHTWKISDASFVGQWGYNFRFDAISSPGEFLVKEVRVTKASASAK